MGMPVIIYGRSGSGKTRSLKGFARDEVLYFDVAGKPLPFKGRFKYTLESDDAGQIAAWLSKAAQDYPRLKAAAVDDATYIMSGAFMRGHGRAKDSFKLYNDIALGMYGLFQAARKLPEGHVTYFLMHEDRADDGAVKLMTIGRLLDSKVMLEGMVTVALRCMSTGGRHFFRTQTNGADFSKSPEGMFEGEEVDNDLKAVDSRIRAFYGWDGGAAEDQMEAGRSMG